MDSNFGIYISSPLVTFIVGPTRKKITVHSDPLASLSSTLHCLLNGPMLEAKTHRVDWSEVIDEDTFIRLCEYAYVRDYTPPSCTERSYQTLVSASGMAEKQTEASEWGYRSSLEPSSDQPPAETPCENYADEPMALEAEAEEEVVQTPDLFYGYALPYREKSIWSRHLRDRGNCDPKNDFTPVFLGHTKLYILADKYGIVSLADLVLGKLAMTLSCFTLCEDDIDVVAELVRASYQDTMPNDALRTLVTTYIVSVLGQIGGNTGFQKLLSEGGDFVVDFWQIIWK
ncbi:uncharacterized protein BO88DRAFT_427270 [Aspergillus vadensis CBS 113365]|uniref:BTB domain-containing protein n=1 Tax=Aspergillus vadensis (strain CBS 113365 / IMI 142717 / IBT 24658) TaxID=1448311 RepID=A0A319BVE8_ASPVC|nr:hypothetical protein BO88DRAFT_427270 [Aspergillus vadensis CBS 113365]PYH67108.1 hypothetical protein BO88DRAFT_427270 [Aspergillus vadensis CBS 113365]